MSVLRSQIESALSLTVPAEIIKNLLDNYQQIKQQFFLHKFQPSELNGARFAECVLRVLEFENSGTFTEFGKQLKTEDIINKVSNNVNLPEGVRILIPRTVRVLLDIRNKRNVAHAGGEVNSNYSDSLFVSNCVDWILIELIRNYHTNTIDEAKKIVDNINEIKIPVITEIEGFVKIQNTEINTLNKALLIIYYKYPEKVLDKDIALWIKYNNISRFRTDILNKLDKLSYIHYMNNYCVIIPKGILHIEKNVSLVMTC